MIKRAFLVIRGFFPSQLPKSGQEFDDFSLSVITTYNLPDFPSYRNAIATMILHLDPLTWMKPKYYFAKSIKKAMCNEIAFQKIQDFKKADEEKKKLEAEAAETNKDASSEPVV